MQIEEIRKHFQKQTITKDSVLVDGDTVVNFIGRLLLKNIISYITFLWRNNCFKKLIV